MVEKLEKIISQSQNIVFFGGAGVSTESGIPDFRSVDGLYHQKYSGKRTPRSFTASTAISSSSGAQSPTRPTSVWPSSSGRES